MKIFFNFVAIDTKKSLTLLGNVLYIMILHTDSQTT